MEKQITFKNVNKTYGKKNALENMDLAIKNNAITVLFGDNGAGKTTLMKALTTQIKIDSGEMSIENHVIHFNQPTNKAIGVLIEEPSLYPYLSGREHLNLFKKLEEQKNNDLSIEWLIDEFKLEKFIDMPTKKYSMGMRQRLGIAMTLVTDPDIIVLDEPFNGLDPKSVKSLRDTFITLRNKGKTLLISSHLIREIAEIVEFSCYNDRCRLKDTTYDVTIII